MRRSVLIAAALTGVPCTPMLAAQEIGLEPCQLPGVAETVLCGSHAVWENRATRSGRRIVLRLAVLPAHGSSPAPDPIVVLEGGPGASNIGVASGVANSPLRGARDILLIDARGTGSSAPLDCDFQSGHGALAFLQDFLPLDEVRDCRKSLARSADLTQYVTPNVVDDLDEVRAALGIGQVNLWASSGGTRQALVWMRRHPGSVRSALLEGPVPVDARIPLTFAADAQDALDGVLEECLAAPECGSRFPDIEHEFAAVVERLERAPATVRVAHPQTGAVHRLTLTSSAFAQIIRYMLYAPRGAMAVPLAVHRAAHENFDAIGQRAVTLGVAGGVSYGFYLSNTCSEDLPFFTEAEAAERARGTFLRTYRVRQQKDACAEWPRAALPAGYLTPVQSKVPVFILVGERDPVTPPRWGHEVVQHLARGRVVIVPDGGHSFAGLENEECLDELRVRFFESASVAVDTACVNRIRRKPFLTDPNP